MARKHLKAWWNFATPGKLSWLIGEILRVPDAPLTGPFTRGQFLSLFMFIIGFAFLWHAWQTHKRFKAECGLNQGCERNNRGAVSAWRPISNRISNGPGPGTNGRRHGCVPALLQFWLHGRPIRCTDEIFFF